MRVYITGVSGGLGKALVQSFLSRGYNVVGIGRRNTISHPLFSFIKCDLSDIEAVCKLRFEADLEGCILVNNAGVVGPLKRISDQSSSEIMEVMTVNTLTPMLLCNQFLTQISPGVKAVILNISSGAANRPIPSWAAYCASKIALDRFSETLLLEELEKGRQISVYSIAPGVVDTDMQNQIRSADPEDFSSLETFKELHRNRDLQDPTIVSEKLVNFILSPSEGNVVRSVKDL